MTIDEAIAGFRYCAEILKSVEEEKIAHDSEYNSCECEQIAEWLVELKELREQLSLENIFTNDAQRYWFEKGQQDILEKIDTAKYYFQGRNDFKNDLIKYYQNEYHGMISDETEFIYQIINTINLLDQMKEGAE